LASSLSRAASEALTSASSRACAARLSSGAAHLEEPDPVCAGLDLPRTTLEAAPRLVLNNSSGFGGSNVCHVLRRPA